MSLQQSTVYVVSLVGAHTHVVAQAFQTLEDAQQWCDERDAILKAGYELEWIQTPLDPRQQWEAQRSLPPDTFRAETPTNDNLEFYRISAVNYYTRQE